MAALQDVEACCLPLAYFARLTAVACADGLSPRCAARPAAATHPLQRSPTPVLPPQWRCACRRQGVGSHPACSSLPQVNGARYALFECVYVRPWPNAAPWIARIEEILSRIGRNNKVQTFLGVRWFYRRRDLLPSGAAEFPPCDDPEREVYMCSGKLDELPCTTLVRPAPAIYGDAPTGRRAERTPVRMQRRRRQNALPSTPPPTACIFMAHTATLHQPRWLCSHRATCAVAV